MQGCPENSLYRGRKLKACLTVSDTEIVQLYKRASKVAAVLMQKKLKVILFPDADL